MKNYINEKNRKNRRNEAKIFDENKSENFCETAIIAMKEIFVEVDAIIEMKIKNFRNTISMFAKTFVDVINFLIKIFKDNRLRIDATAFIEICNDQR